MFPMFTSCNLILFRGTVVELVLPPPQHTPHHHHFPQLKHSFIKGFGKEIPLTRIHYLLPSRSTLSGLHSL